MGLSWNNTFCTRTIIDDDGIGFPIFIENITVCIRRRRSADEFLINRVSLDADVTNIVICYMI